MSNIFLLFLAKIATCSDIVLSKKKHYSQAQHFNVLQ